MFHPYKFTPPERSSVSPCICSLLSADMERTFIAVKPDGVQRGLCGEIIKRFETRGFRLVAGKFVQVTMTTDAEKETFETVGSERGYRGPRSVSSLFQRNMIVYFTLVMVVVLREIVH